MDIVKRLSLNKTPKDVENNSIVAAKNIMVDSTGSFITSEPGFNVAFECPNDGEFIVGIIPCTEEIVIFTYCTEDKESRVYRYYDKDYYTQCDTGWKYSGGKIIGTYTYNYKKELIIAVAEYGGVDVYGNELMIPLKSWNLDNSNSAFSYNIEEIIPKFTNTYVINSGGSLLCGIYTFFIRFKLDDNSYTKWFQITDDIVITNIIPKEGTHHMFMNANNTAVIDAPITLQNAENFEVNDDTMSSNAVVLDFDFTEDCKYNEYQIGYIYKRKSDLVARIKSTYKTSSTSISITNNDFIEEALVDDMLESPHQFYNVKSITNYNNRLYIANYDEYRNENLEAYAEQIKVDLITRKKEESTSVESVIKHYAADISTALGEGYGACSVYISDVPYYQETTTVGGQQVTKTYVKNPVNFIKQNIAENTWLRNEEINKTHNISKSIKGSWTKDGNYVESTWNFGIYVMLKDTPGSEICLYSTTGSNYNYKIEISDTLLEPVKIIKGNGEVYNLTNSNVGYNIKVSVNYTVNKADNYSDWLWYFNDGDPKSLSGGLNFAFLSRAYNVRQIIASDNLYNNNRTLIPNQIYALFAHYIRPDFSVTDGFRLTAGFDYTEQECPYDIVVNTNGDRLFKIKDDNLNLSGSNDSAPLVFPVFTNIKYPKTYIGCFISYEAIETSVIPVSALKYASNVLDVTNTNYIFNDDQIYGTKLRNMTDHADNGVISSKTVHKNQLIEPYISLRITGGSGVSSSDVNDIFGVIVENENIYSKSSKKLYRLTNNIFGAQSLDFGIQDSDKPQEAFMHLPGFYNKEKIIYYNKELIMSPEASNVIDGDGQKQDSYTITLKTKNTYSDKPLVPYIVFQDYTQGAASLVNDQAEAQGVFYNKILQPDKLKTFLQLPQAYQAKPDKIYTNYSKSHTDRFAKTIYRSNVVSDESLVNGFREFVSTNYKNILENKGDIINIIGIGLYLIVHTQYSLFVFDRSPKLTNKSQLDIPDVFDISYQEVMPSNEGFGGLADKDEAILTKHGYFWFDKINKYIFIYENGNAKIISQDINNLIKNLDIKTVRFAEDIVNNRLIVCIYLNDTYTVLGVTRNCAMTISYSFVTKTFISLHDYTFTDNYRTYNRSYLFDDNKDRKRLYTYDKNESSYLNLIEHSGTYYPIYYNVINEQDQEDEGQPIRPWVPDFDE